MKRYRVIITPFAGENIREAHEWLKAENPTYAAKWLSGIKDKILELETFPESHAGVTCCCPGERGIRR